MRIHSYNHPLIQHKLSILRNKNTGAKEFRELVKEISSLLVYEATRDIPLQEVSIDTPIMTIMCKKIPKNAITVVPVLRAGLGMLEGVLDIIPNISVGHIGMYRDEETLKPVEYYINLPKDIKNSEILVIDPMLATGGSAVDAINLIKDMGVSKVKLLCIIAAPQGLDYMESVHPDVDIYLASIDEGLNAKSYIVPGLGDAGDRLFGTK